MLPFRPLTLCHTMWLRLLMGPICFSRCSGSPVMTYSCCQVIVATQLSPETGKSSNM